MIPTTADFYDETGRRARWLGAMHGNADPEALRGLDSGRLMLEATDPATFADAVLALLEVFTEQGLGQATMPETAGRGHGRTAAAPTGSTSSIKVARG